MTPVASNQCLQVCTTPLVPLQKAKDLLGGSALLMISKTAWAWQGQGTRAVEQGITASHQRSSPVL